MKERGIRFLAAQCLCAGVMLCAAPVYASVDPAPPIHLEEQALNLQQQHEVFPRPAAIQGSVDFWRKVYAEWHLNQVALHDAEYPGLVYEVIDLGGDAQEGYTREQSDKARRHREALEKRLERIAKTDELSLSEEDVSLRHRIIAEAGEEGLAEAYLRVRVQRGLRERFQRGLEISGQYDDLFRRIFREEGVPEDLAYLPHVESSFQNRARSSVGATGMWQFTRSAGRLFMTVNRTVDERLDPVASARGAARYLRQAHELLGDWALAITSYNHGVQGMLRAKAQYGADFGRIVREYKSRTFGFASRNFYAEFLAASDIARDHDRYFPEGVQIRQPLALEHVKLDQAINSRELAHRYDVGHAELVALNPAWASRIAGGKMAIPAGATVWLPAGTLSRSAEDKTGGPPRTDVAEGDAHPSDTHPSKVVFHLVRAGESLSTIAKHHGLTLDVLKAINNLGPEGDMVRIGQRLRLRDASESGNTEAKDDEKIIHVVRRGDTPWLIAVNYGVSVKELLASNQLTRHSVLRPGQRLGIPVSR